MSQMPCFALLQSHAGLLAARRSAAGTLFPGIRVGGWRIDGPCCVGHSSDTYRVVLARGTEHATLTVFDIPALQLGSYPRRIGEIARRLATVEHPGVINVVNSGLLADGRPYVVTDVQEGATLPQMMPDGTCLARMRAVTILRGICAPLIAAHDIGIVHGALDLDNVFLVEEDDHYIKLLDWGIERAVLDEARRAGAECPPRVTCVAPEEALGLRSPQTDAYAFGVLAYRLLLGRAPFEAETAVALRAMQTQNRPDPRQLWPTIPASLETLLCELLAPDPRARPSIRNASERLAAITREELVSEETAPLYNDYEDYDVAVASKLPHALWWGLGMAACGAVLAAVLMSAMGTSEAPTAHRAPRAHAAAPSILASAAPAIVQPAVPPAFKPAPPPTTFVPPPPASPPAILKHKPRATPPPAPMVAHVPRTAPTSDLEARNGVLADYQRLGRALFEMRQQRGVAATSELWQQFRALQIEPAVATAQSRAAADATLRELRTKIERQQRIEIADACLKNPLADGCR